MNKKRVLITVIGYYPAKEYGGPPVSVQNLCDSLHNEIDFYIVTSNHERGRKEKLPEITEGWQKVGNAHVIYLAEKDKTKRKYLEIIKDIKPNCIYLNSFFDALGVLPVLDIAKKERIDVLLAPRGELCEGAMENKKILKLLYISLVMLMRWNRGIMYQATSDDEKESIAKYLRAKEKEIILLDNIPSSITANKHNCNKTVGKASFVFVSRIHRKKNLLSAIRYFNSVKDDVLFDIYGPLEDVAYWDLCKAEISNLPKNVVTRYCGVVNHNDVQDVFSKYDAFIFPTNSENYGHVIFESLAVGTPVIISNKTPWNFINNENAGIVVELEDNDGFVEAINRIISMNSKEYTLMSDNAKRVAYDKNKVGNMKEKYLKAFISDC